MAKRGSIAEQMLTQERLRELLKYDPETGLFINILSRGGLVVGETCGRIANHGYVHICIDYRMYLGHRLACFWMTGKWPANQVDHRNLVRSDNRWENLREATFSEQRQNQRVRSDSTLGIKGVSLLPSGKYRAEISVNGVRHYLGRKFATAEEASRAYQEAKARLHVFQPTVPA